MLPVHSLKLLKCSFITTVIRKRKSSLLKGRSVGDSIARQAEVTSKHQSDTQRIGTLTLTYMACWQQQCHSPNVDCPLAAISKQPVERKGTGWDLPHLQAGVWKCSRFSVLTLKNLGPAHDIMTKLRHKRTKQIHCKFSSRVRSHLITWCYAFLPTEMSRGLGGHVLQYDHSSRGPTRSLQFRYIDLLWP